MYLPKHFAEPRVDVMHALLRAYPLATLVTLTPDGPDANLVPLHLSPDPAPFGTLRGHVARANPLWRDHAPETDVLAIFRGPQTYVSPSWYPTKAETGRVVPTWNYAVVHARGRLQVVDDPARLRAHLEALTAQQEARFSSPWAVSDAPADHVDKLIGAIVGIEIVVTRLEGKWKTSQNQPRQNQAGVVSALRVLGDDEAVRMAALVGQHLNL